MSEKARRARFQIRLSTALILLFVCGGQFLFTSTDSYKFQSGRLYKVKSFGWPLKIDCFLEPVNQARYGGPDGISFYQENDPPPWVAVQVDLFETMSISFLIIVVCEWLIRRREARKS